MLLQGSSTIAFFFQPSNALYYFILVHTGCITILNFQREPSSIGGSNTLYQAPRTFSLPLEQLLQHYYSCQGLNRNVSAIFYKSIMKTWCTKNWIWLISGLDTVEKQNSDKSFGQMSCAREFLELDTFYILKANKIDEAPKWWKFNVGIVQIIWTNVNLSFRMMICIPQNHRREWFPSPWIDPSLLLVALQWTPWPCQSPSLLRHLQLSIFLFQKKRDKKLLAPNISLQKTKYPVFNIVFCVCI